MLIYDMSCFCLIWPSLENPRDGGAWWAAVSGVAQSWRRLKRLSSSILYTCKCVCMYTCMHTDHVHEGMRAYICVPIYVCMYTHTQVFLKLRNEEKNSQGHSDFRLTWHSTVLGVPAQLGPCPAEPQSPVSPKGRLT